MNNKIINRSAFISQPMNGKTYDEILDTRKRIIKAMREQHDINITYVTNDFDYTPECPARTVMLGNSIAKLEESGIIIFTKDAFEAKGCRIEAKVCTDYSDEFVDKIYVELDDGTITNIGQAVYNDFTYVYSLPSFKEMLNKNNCIKDLEDQLAKKSETIRKQSVEISVLTNSNINAKSKIKELASELESAKTEIRERTDFRLKDLQRIKDLEDVCDQRAEDNKKLSIELADKKELIDKMYKDLNRLEDIRDTQFNKLCDKDKRIEELKRMANSVYGLTGGGVICYDCKRKYDNRIKHLESCIKNYKSRIENKNKDIDILLEAVKKIEANKYDDNDIIGKD